MYPPLIETNNIRICITTFRFIISHVSTDGKVYHSMQYFIISLPKDNKSFFCYLTLGYVDIRKLHRWIHFISQVTMKTHFYGLTSRLR